MDTTSPFLGLRTCIYYVDNLKDATEWYTSVLKTSPYFEEDFYVGFNIAGYELGLLPDEEKQEKGKGQAVYWGVHDINEEYDRLMELGATSVEKPTDVGGGIFTASLKDPWNNTVGIIYNPFFMTTPENKPEAPRVTGLGGVFLKSDDPDGLKNWYEKHLGIPAGPYGSTFEWRWARYPERKGFTAWSIMPSSTDYFDPGKQEVMINYRVNNLSELIKKLKAQDVTIAGEMEEFDYGKFAWIMDPDGNKIELWEPVDEVYAQMGDNSVK